MPAPEFDALCRAWGRRERRLETRKAELIVAIVNSQGGKLQVSDLLPPDPEEEQREAPNGKEAFLAFVKAGVEAQKLKGAKVLEMPKHG